MSRDARNFTLGAVVVFCLLAAEFVVIFLLQLPAPVAEVKSTPVQPMYCPIVRPVCLPK